MKVRGMLLLAALAAALSATLVFTRSDGTSARADEPKKDGPRVVLAETFNGVTKLHFTNVAVHKGSPEPNAVKRRFRADVKYWLMDAKYYDQGALSIGNPELAKFVIEAGSKSLTASEPTTLPSMAYGLARAVLVEYPIIRKIEVRLVHFAKGLEVEDEANNNHVVNVVLER